MWWMKSAKNFLTWRIKIRNKQILQLRCSCSIYFTESFILSNLLFRQNFDYFLYKTFGLESIFLTHGF